ncbi:MAG: TraR/DksA family transcriptional regulator [Bacteroidales bacterium]|nr:TraR/DksA family transcriptional regulator [Bacteroidales bacterium]
METPSTPQEKTRYSAEELHEFKELILRKIAEAKRNLELLNQAVAGSENDVRDTSHTIMTIDDGQEVLAKEENSKLAARQMRFIKDLEAALIRIENNTYGICRITGKLIPKERLMIVPHATTTVEGKNMQSSKQKIIPSKPIV